MKKLAIFIKTINRENALFNCIESIDKNLDNVSYRFYIADDGFKTKKKSKLYNKLKKNDHVIKELDYNLGASQSRNILLKNLKEEKYVLRLDDDFEITEETNIKAMINILENNDNISVISDLEKQIGTGKSIFSGEINPWQGIFFKRGKNLIKKMIKLNNFIYFTQGDYKYAYCDFSRNFLLIKRAVFDQVSWDDDISFAYEHEDFMLQLKENGYNLVFTPNSIHLHRDDIESSEIYHEEKINDKNKNISIINFKEKWDIKNVTFKRPIKYIFKAFLVKLYNLFIS
jgi:GT2 family glycosyltransferase